MLREEYLHEMKQIGSMALYLKKGKRTKRQLLLISYINRFEALLDKMSREYLEKENKNEENNVCTNDGITKRMCSSGNTD